MKEKQYAVSCNEDQDGWYTVRRWEKGGLARHEILPGRYDTAEDAAEAMIVMFEANR